jgi:ABC-2 type transport system permease protein
VTGPPETLEHLDLDPALRPLARAMALRGPGWWAVLRMELRKVVDTGGSRWVLASALLLVVAAVLDALLAVRAAGAAAHGPLTGQQVGDLVRPAVLVLPVVGVLATTSEWSRRTALSTFVLVPRRGRVLAAQAVAAVLVVVAAALACCAVALLGALVVAQPAGLAAGAAAPVLTQAVVVAVLCTLAAVGLGALVGRTAPALLALAALPVCAVVVSLVPGSAGAWVDGYRAAEQVAQGAVVSWPQAGTALALWVVLPLVAGTARWVRRDVP